MSPGVTVRRGGRFENRGNHHRWRMSKRPRERRSSNPAAPTIFRILSSRCNEPVLLRRALVRSEREKRGAGWVRVKWRSAREASSASCGRCCGLIEATHTQPEAQLLRREAVGDRVLVRRAPRQNAPATCRARESALRPAHRGECRCWSRRVSHAFTTSRNDPDRHHQVATVSRVRVANYDEDHPVPNLQIAPTSRAGAITQTGVGSHAALLKTTEDMLGVPFVNQGQLPAATDFRSLEGI